MLLNIDHGNFQYRYAYTSMMKMHLDKIEKVEQVSQKNEMLFSVHLFVKFSFLLDPSPIIIYSCH